MADKSILLVPPHNIEAERSILASIICRPVNLDTVLQTLTFADFYQIKHQRILRAMSEMSATGQEIDIITLADKLKSIGFLTDIGGTSYLLELHDEFISDAYIKDHIKIVKDKSTLRALIEVTTLVTAECYKEHENVPAFLDHAERVIADASNFNKHKTIMSMADSFPEIMEMIDQINENRGKINGIESGFVDLDKMTNGFQKKDLIIVAARPSVGKTAFAVNIAEHCAQKGVPVGVFSLEMSNTQLIFRMLSSLSGIPGERIRSGSYLDRDHGKMAEALGKISALPIYIDDVSAQTMLELRSKARIMKREYQIQLLIIDYLQLMQSGERVENRNLEVGQITRQLKLMAKELDIPIILLSQLNREVEKRGDKRPGLSDLRDSGSVEQDADVVMFLYRESLYAPTDENKRTAELIVSKQRNGPTGVVNLIFEPGVTQFKNGVSQSAAAEEPPSRWYDN